MQPVVRVQLLVLQLLVNGPGSVDQLLGSAIEIATLARGHARACRPCPRTERERRCTETQRAEGR
jgi:hypothetical protein